MSKVQSVLFTLLGLGRAGQILYVTLFVLAVPLLAAYTVWLPASASRKRTSTCSAPPGTAIAAASSVRSPRARA